MGLALSASWNAFRHTDGKQMIFEILEAGFSEVELSFNLTRPMLNGVEEVLRQGLVKIVSLHNYCPTPDALEREEALPDCYSMSSLDEDERAYALKFAKRTIDTAASFGAKAVVLHCGRVEIPDKTRQLVDLCNNGLKDSKAFNKMSAQARANRKEFAGKFLSQTLRSLDELNRHARQKGVLLGIETRVYYREIPSFEEIGVILDKFKDSNIFYWHDTGHAEILEMVGFACHADFLKRYGLDMIGLHLHDCFNGQDHLAPSQGTLDFNQFTPYLKKETLKVIEAHHPADKEAVVRGREFLRGIFDGAA